MHYKLQTILSVLALLAGITSALPSVDPGRSDTSSLVRRGGEPECVKCPPDVPPPCNNCTKGCIYIECNDCDQKADCCKCLGLEKKTPYVRPLSPQTHFPTHIRPCYLSPSS